VDNQVMLTIAEVELLAGLLARTGLTVVEIAWVNSKLTQLRAIATASAQLAEGTGRDSENARKPAN